MVLDPQTHFGHSFAEVMKTEGKVIFIQRSGGCMMCKLVKSVEEWLSSTNGVVLNESASPQA
jgi:hypothetical protein